MNVNPEGVPMLEQYTTKEVQVIIESSHDGIIVVDREARVRLVNDLGMKILGLPNNIIGEKITEFIPNSDLIRILETGKTEMGDIATVLNRNLVINRLPIIENGQLVGVVSNFKEINDIQRMEMKIRKKFHQKGLEAKHQLADIAGSSTTMEECKTLAEKYGKTNATVMILGDSGTGKELFAQGIHLSGARAKGPFVAINCAAIPESLLESELFGYDDGTFTGAVKGGKGGLIELAHGGTIFLDEIGEMSLKIQAMLLRILEERQVRRIGGQKLIPVDIRVVVATNRRLETMVEQGEFRKDLYYRLNVLTLDLPPLRERLEDIPVLVESILTEFNDRRQSKIHAVSDEVLALFSQYDWPGNVRELRNVIERMVLMSEGDILTMKDARFFERKLPKKTSNQPNKREMEEMAILSVLKETKGNKTMAARKLGVDRSTLWRRIKKYGL